MTKNSKKISDASFRVLETLKLLVEKESSIQEIINHFEKIDPYNRIYTSEVILKYINTLKVFGCRFVKRKNKYFLLNLPNQIDFTETELRTIFLLRKIADLIHEEKIKMGLNDFLQNLEKRFTDNTLILAHRINKPDLIDFRLGYEKYAKQIKKYEKHCIEGQKLKITYKNLIENISITAEPKEIKYVKSRIYLSVYNPALAQIHDINLNDIIEVKQLPQRANRTNMMSSTTFTIKGRLAKAYKLRDSENVLKIKPDGSQVIINNKEDKSLLLKRLMRYGPNCEVTSPQSLRIEMAEMIEKTLKNYT